MHMPWGKYRGQLISEVPSGYLAFVVEGSNANPELKVVCKQVLAARFGGVSEPQPANRLWQRGYKPPPDSSGVCREKLKRWYRRASLLAHPDRGGSTELMKLINELTEY
jgi:uncharacterized protein (DUF3820 family)